MNKPITRVKITKLKRYILLFLIFYLLNGIDAIRNTMFWKFPDIRFLQRLNAI